MTSRRHLLIVATAGSVVAAMAAATATARPSVSMPQAARAQAGVVTKRSAKVNPHLLAALTSAIARGFIPTQVGEQILAGTFARSKPAAADDGLAVQVVIATKPINPSTGTTEPTRRVQSARHRAGTTYVFAHCGYGIASNVTFEYSRESWTVWDQTNVFDQDRQVYGPTTTCSGSCLAYAYDTPPSTWTNEIAEENETYGNPVHETEWCG